MKFVMVVAALALSSMGCKSDCEQVCERSRDCGTSDFGDSFLADASCGDLCDLSEEFAELINCEDAWHDYVGCVADNTSDDCQANPNASCGPESEAYSACFDDD